MKITFSLRHDTLSLSSLHVLSLFSAGPRLLRAKARPLRESMYPYILFLGLLRPLRSHTLHISHLNCLPDMKRKKLPQQHPRLPLLSHPHREPWTPAQFCIESVTILFNLFFNKKCNRIGYVLISLAQHQHQLHTFTYTRGSGMES